MQVQLSMVVEHIPADTQQLVMQPGHEQPGPAAQ